MYNLNSKLRNIFKPQDVPGPSNEHHSKDWYTQGPIAVDENRNDKKDRKIPRNKKISFAMPIEDDNDSGVRMPMALLDVKDDKSNSIQKSSIFGLIYKQRLSEANPPMGPRKSSLKKPPKNDSYTNVFSSGINKATKVPQKVQNRKIYIKSYRESIAPSSSSPRASFDFRKSRNSIYSRKSIDSSRPSAVSTKSRKSVISNYVTVVDVDTTRQSSAFSAPISEQILPKVFSLKEKASSTKRQCHVCHPFSTTNTLTGIMRASDTERSYSGKSIGSSTVTFKDDLSTCTLYFQNIVASHELMVYTERDQFTSFILRWNFLNVRDEIYFNTLTDGGVLNDFRSYPIKISAAYYLYLLRCPMPMELYVCYEYNATGKFIGRCDVKFAFALKSVNEMYEIRLDITNYQLCCCYTEMIPTHFGYLVCAYGFSGSQDHFDKFKPIIKISEPMDTMGNGSIGSMGDLSRPNSMDRRQNLPRRSNVLQSDLEVYQEELNMVLIRNKALQTTQADVAEELKENIVWMHEELKWQLTLRENAILCGNDPNEIKWRQWKDEGTAEIKFRSVNDDVKEKSKADIVIKIVNLKLNNANHIMTDGNIVQIFVEYEFMDQSGKNMETLSLPKTDEIMTFDFERNFPINIRNKNTLVFAEQIRNKEYITFTVVGEPNESFSEIQTCKVIGYSQIGLFDLIQSSVDTVSEIYPVMDDNKENTKIGLLRVDISGVLDMRQLVLKTLKATANKT